MSADRLVALGVFGAPQGVRGEIRVKSYTADPTGIASYGPLTDAAGARRFAMTALRPLRDDLIVARVEGVDGREAAAALTGTEVFARRSQLPPPAPDEFYHDDLVGLEAASPEGVAFGRVTAVLNHGAGDILEIARPGELTLLLPFTRQVVPEIDFVAGRILAIPPLELDGEASPGEQEPHDRTRVHRR